MTNMTKEEWNELQALKNAINWNPASVHPDKMEKFTELLVKSWDVECEPPDTKKWRKNNPLDE